jgi:3'-5' exoribonuclease
MNKTSVERSFIEEIQPNTQVDEVFRVVDKQQRANRQGNLYLLIQLSDRTGTISGLRWNADARLYDSFQKGDYLRVQAGAQLHNGQMQLIVHQFQVVDPALVDSRDFDRLDRDEVESCWQEIKQLVSTIQQPGLRRVAEAFLEDPQLAGKFKVAPAGVKAHHAFPGGLLAHVRDLMKLAELLASRYPTLHRDLLLVGALLHDIGKLEELSFDGELNYTDPGQLVGHLVQGVQLLDRKLADVEAQHGERLPTELVWRLQHMIVSHHGQLEHGSPRIPMTLEAIALHFIDDLDAKLNMASEWIRADRNSDSPWTAFHPMLGRKLYKPSLEE